MENIIIEDDFLKEDDLEILKSIINSKQWTYGHTSSGRELVNTPFWFIDLKEELFFAEYIKDLIEEKFNKKFKLNRVYANGQTYGQNGSYHVDDTDPNSYTFCLYLHKLQKNEIETAGGQLNVKIPNEQYSISIEPILNRGVLFPSNYYHKGYAFSRYVTDMRICIAWKLKEIII